MDLKDKQFALKLARDTINLWVLEGKKHTLKSWPDKLKEKQGVFVTIYTWPEKKLRGCIGYPEPAYPLGPGIIEAAIKACSDPRFEFLKDDELENVIVEVSVLSKPKLIEVRFPEKEYPEKIVIGKHGLIVKRGVFSGLLLPKVATEHGLDVNEFLIETCLKAGLPPTAWMDTKTKVYKFQAEDFAEEKPGKGLDIEPRRT